MSYLYEPNVFIPLPNGMRLAARIWKPEDVDHHPAPAVLEFLPYRRRDMTAPRDELTYPQFAAQGIAGVRVDMRGTGESDGLFDDEYSEQELSDAEAVIAWIADQPWCNGHVGMMGISWGGFNALQVAARRPPALGAVISIASTVDRYGDDIHFKGGTMLSSNLYWANQMLCYNARVPDSAVRSDWRTLWHYRLENTAPVVEPWFTHQRRDDYWAHGSICEDFAAVQVPSWVIAGWADGYRNTPWKARAGMGDRCQMMIGPWIHKYPHFAKPGPQFDFIDEACAFWHRHLGTDRGAVQSAASRLYLLEAVDPTADRTQDPGQWIAIDDGSPSVTQLYLSAAGLTPVSPPDAPQVTVCSPLVSALAGGEYFCGSIDEGMSGEQSADDALGYALETAVLEEPMELIGMATLRISVAIDAPQGHLIARLVDVHPDGTSSLITRAFLNLSHRNGPQMPEPMTVGQFESVEMVFDAAAYRVRAGHRLRLVLTTEYFPFILPSPTRVSAVIALGATAMLSVPCYAYDPIDVPQGAHRLPQYEVKAQGHTRRDVHREGDLTRVSLSTDTGHLVHPEHGIEWRDTRCSTWSANGDDPLSIVGEEENHDWHWRDGVEVHVIATARLTTDGVRWNIETSLTAFEDRAQIFGQTWRYAISRDHI